MELAAHDALLVPGLVHLGLQDQLSETHMWSENGFLFQVSKLRTYLECLRLLRPREVGVLGRGEVGLPTRDEPRVLPRPRR